MSFNLLHLEPQKTMPKKTLTVLGNCVAERLLLMLRSHPGLLEAFDIKRFNIIPYIKKKDLKHVAKLVQEYDIIFSQPLFNYGPCNTSEIRKNLKPHQELIIFSSPEFSAYFPELHHFNNSVPSTTPKPLEWDSRIIFSCFVNKVPLHEVEAIYTSHWFFHKKNMLEHIDKSLENYVKREQGVDLSTLTYFLQNFRKERLIHSPRHPTLSFLKVMYDMMIDALGLPKLEPQMKTQMEWAKLDFNQHQLPIITRNHDLFAFPEQDDFVIVDKRLSIERMAADYYQFYEHHPRFVVANLHLLVSLEGA